MRVVVDNSAGGDAELAAGLAEGLRTGGHAVELREPEPASMFDTAVHLVSAGIELHVDERPAPDVLREMSAIVRGVLIRQASARRRSRAVPVVMGAGRRVLVWIDAFG